MKEIKIIDLINLAYEDKAPKKIEVFNQIFIYTGDKRPQRFYIMEKQENYLLRDFVYTLNTKVEIIEEDNNKIENLPKWATTREDKEYTKQEDHILVVAQKVNEIIDKINNMED